MRLPRMSDEEIQLARERIKRWPIEERRALARMTEQEVRTIALATALLDLRPVEGGEVAAGPAPVAEGRRDPLSEPPVPPSTENEFAMWAETLDPKSVLPYRANEHPTPAHEGAEKTVAREGEKHVVSPRSHRHKLLQCFAEVERMTLIQAGQYALEHYGVGEGTIIGWDEGRRRSSELAEFNLLDRVHESLYSINEHGRTALRMCDEGVRWKSDEHDWTPEQGGLF